MNKKKLFISLKTKIMISTIIPVIISFFLICSVIFISLFNSFHEAARYKFLQISHKYAVNFESQINNATHYLSIVASNLELQVEMDTTDREVLQKTILGIFDAYGIIDGSSIYFEPNMYDGKDNKYIGSAYGTAKSGRICYYFYKDNGNIAYLPEALQDELEFEMPHYAEAKKMNKPIYTKPEVHEIDGIKIPMFTLTYPVRGAENTFIGAVTVDLFLEDMYLQLQNEEIYETGYIVITSDKGQVIYSPIFDDIGKTCEEAGVNYELPSENETVHYSNAKSLLNGMDCFISTYSIYMPQMDSFFYVTVVAPTEEIDARGTNLMIVLGIFSTIVVMLIGILLHYLIGRITEPIIEITECANKIANGHMDEASTFESSGENPRIVDEVYILFIAIKKMLSQLKEMQELKLESLELKYKKEKAEAAAQAKNNFLARMSHEIRTPMNAVVGMCELILRKKLPQDVYENALVIKASSSNLLSIINDILDFSKIESGMLEIIETDYLLPSLINDVINVIRVRLIDKPLQFIVNIDPDIPSSLIGDEVRIRQILINLLSNAVKYTNEGHISLTATGNINGNEVTLTLKISDSGIGVKDEDIEKLFRDFVQIDTVTNKGIEGTGLGLAISSNLCRAMGGSITVQSEYRKGSTFTVTLPQRFGSYKPFASINNPGEKSVLLYETRSVYRDSIVGTLERLGVNYKSVDSIAALFDDLGKFDYAFISSFMYGSINPALCKIDKPPKLVLMADLTETIAPKDARVLSLPAHSLSIVNILNDIYENHNGVHVVGASFIAPEAKILIVDDIMANLKVGEGLILPYETQITLCQSGREAIDLIASNRYDLVFMDHMMPEMDGLEVTSYIRKMDGEYFKTLPIVALTANAVSGMREMFIQNGMNDFLAKPIEISKLDIILGKWIPKYKQKKIIASEATEEENGFVNILKTVPELYVDQALSIVGGSSKTYERMVRLSVRLLPENIDRLNHLINTSFPNYSIEVHGIKSVLKNIGAYTLGDMAYELEKLSNNGDVVSCKEMHPTFIDALGKFTETMTSLMEETSVSDNLQGDNTMILEALPRLEESADFFDSARALEILSSVSQFTYGQMIDKAVEDLVSAYEHFDFDSAVELIHKLKDELGVLSV